MTTTFPTNPDTYTTKVDGVDTVMAAHINDLQDAMMAVQDFALDLRDDLGKWQSYTVSWTATTTNPSIGNENDQLPEPNVVLLPGTIKILQVTILPIWTYFPLSVPFPIAGLVVDAVQDTV